MNMWNRKRQPTNSDAKRGLDRATETELAIRAREHNDIQARNILVESHMGLVKRMATAFARRGASFEDLVQEGGLALMRAAQTFEPERNIRFATYAAYWIRSHMQRYLASLRSYQYAAPASVAYTGGHTRGAEGVRRLLRTTSLDAPVSGESDRAMIDTIQAEQGTPEESVERVESRDRVRNALVKAFNEINDDRAAVVIKRRLLSDDPATLAEIGEALDLSREGARLLELRLIRKMKAAMAERAA